jgi:hypothetical protein
MARAPEGHRQAFFARGSETTTEIRPVEYRDYLALDYLINTPTATSRLHPVGLVDRTRLLSMTFDWSQAEFLVAQAGGRPVGLAVYRATPAGREIDAFADREGFLAVLLAAVRKRAGSPATMYVAEADAAKEATALRLGFQPLAHTTEVYFDREIRFGVYQTP